MIPNFTPSVNKKSKICSNWEESPLFLSTNSHPTFRLTPLDKPPRSDYNKRKPSLLSERIILKTLMGEDKLPKIVPTEIIRRECVLEAGGGRMALITAPESMGKHGVPWRTIAG